MKVTLEVVYEAIQKLDRRVSTLSESTDRRFAQQFGYFEKKFAAFDERLDAFATKEEVNRVLDTLDGNRGSLDAHTTEITALTSQTRRHETWIQKLAQSMARYLKMS